MAKSLVNKNATFGTWPVFLTAISTILGAILFLRFGYAVGNLGLLGVLTIILIGHLVTIPTALAVAEIATNQRVQGGGAYYIISRSFGLNIGGAVGFSLYLSQAISVAFYIIAFGEAFHPLLNYISESTGFVIHVQWIKIVTMAILAVLILTKGANLGVKALYFVVAVLFVALGMFFFGHTIKPGTEFNPSEHILAPDSFFYVFTIIFPAFTGLAAGIGLSGDLKDPQTSIPKGTIWATVVGMLIYVGVAYKLAISASPEDLASNQLIMQDIALWGPIIPIGLAAASLSSALGSIMIAPRTLQAIGYDNVFPKTWFNNWLSKGRENDNEPINGSVITIIIAFVFVVMGDVDFVAKVISMFFMVTYGAICLISFLEHFAADPSYRPTFKHNRWYYSLIGGLLSFWLMFKMNLPYAALSLLLMALFYHWVSVNNKEKKGLQKLFKGVVFQLSRSLQVFAQRANKEDREVSWRPFLICISEDTFKRRSAFDLVRWISYKYGFGTYIHYIKGLLNRKTSDESKVVLERLIKLASGSKNRVYLDTIISPSYTSAIAQVIQLNSISGKGNNMILFEFSHTEPDSLRNALDNYSLIQSGAFDVCILNTTYKGFGYHQTIHIWISEKDYDNSNLMILLAYIIVGHPDWKNGVIKIFSLTPQEDVEHKKAALMELIKSGRLPISPSNVELIPFENGKDPHRIISRYSEDADLTIVGFTTDDLKLGLDYFTSFNDTSNILFVNAYKDKEIV
ncbi:amino acid permease [Saccharicrinis sp. FJH62]|uniref:amino acid permease n=1 Tax=Saccharicrinis sp. FJH62 TaxID=3344657 RepID=UPI0035D4E025